MKKIKTLGTSFPVKMAVSLTAAVVMASGAIAPAASGGLQSFCAPAAITASAAAPLYVPYLNGSNRIAWKATAWTPVYAYSNLSARGNFANLNGSGVKTYGSACIDAGDDCYIYRMWDSVSIVYYPAGNNYRYAYVRTSDITKGYRYQTRNAFRAAAYVNTYRDSNLAASIGSIYANDTCYLLNRIGSSYQMIYPTSGGNYKIGWISARDYSRITSGR